MPEQEFDTCHSQCLLCGAANPKSMRLAFHAQVDGSVRTTFRVQEEWQGYDGILHGGMIAALLDAAMTHCLFHQGVRAMTGELHVRYCHPVPCGVDLEIWARRVTTRPPLYRLESEIRVNNRVMVWAEAKFMKRQDSSPPQD